MSANVLLSILLVLMGGSGLAVLHFKPDLFTKKKKDEKRELNAAYEIPEHEVGDYPLIFTEAPQQVVLGEGARYYHMQVIGVSGAGKNRYGLLPMIYQDIKNGAGAIIFDPKSKMLPQIAAYAQACGRAGQLRYFDLAENRPSYKWTPFTRPDPSQMAESFQEAFYQDDKTPTDFYRQTVLSWSYGVFALYKHLGAIPTFTQLRQLSIDHAALAALVAKAPDFPAAAELRKQFLCETPADYTKLMQGITNKLTSITNSLWAPLVNTTEPNLDLASVIEKGEILYVGLASDLYPIGSKRIATLMLMDIQAKMTARYQESHARSIFLYLDEFGDILYPAARDLIAKAREARIGVIFAHQSLGDLEKFGPVVSKALYESAGSKVLFRLGSAETAESFARLAGTITEKKEMVNYALDGEGILAEKRAKGLTPVEGEAFLMHPNDLKGLGVGEAFLILQRQTGPKRFRGALIDVDRIGIPPVKLSTLLPPKNGVHYPSLSLDLVQPNASGRAKSGLTANGAAAMTWLKGKKND